MPTTIHERVRRARRGENPHVICRLPSGWVVLGDTQTLPGYCLLLSDPVVQDINSLPLEGRAQFLRDLTLIGDALLEATGAQLVNYLILGNLDRALHAHVHPRYAHEPDELRTSGPWVYAPPHPTVPFELERDRPLMQRIAGAIERLAKSSGTTS